MRQALLNTGKLAIGKIAFSGRERVVAFAVSAEGQGVMAYTLRYKDELRDAREYFTDIKLVEISDDALELAESLIATRAAKLDMSKFEDGYELGVRELVDAKVHHLPIPKNEAPRVARGTSSP